VIQNKPVYAKYRENSIVSLGIGVCQKEPGNEVGSLYAFHLAQVISTVLG
jgi:hypothetical protein